MWRNTIFLSRDIHSSSLLRVFFDPTPKYLRKAPGYGFYATSLMRNKESLRSVSKTVGFLQLTAELLIGAEARRVHCPSCAQPPLLYELASLSSRLFDLQHRAWESRPCAFRPPPKAILSTASIAAGHGTPDSPDEPLREAQRDARAQSQMGRALWERSREIGAKACFMVPRWSASAHVCHGKCDRASTDE
jgi:hypothetical protein